MNDTNRPPTVRVQYISALRPACQDCGQVRHPGYTCGEFAQQNAALAAAIDRLLPAALNHGNPGPTFTNPTPPNNT